MIFDNLDNLKNLKNLIKLKKLVIEKTEFELFDLFYYLKNLNLNYLINIKLLFEKLKLAIFVKLADA